MAVKRWNGTSWEIYAGSDLAPVKVTDGRVGKTTFIGATTPTGMVDGDIWIDQDTATNAVVPTALLAKGDIFVATASGAYTRLAAGNNGESLYADSTTSTGLRWQGDYSVGKNKIINGDFGIWQRGTNKVLTQGDTYLADRWRTGMSAISSGTITVSQQAFTPGSAPVAGYESAYFWRIAGTSTPTGLSYLATDSPIEDIRTLAGQTVTFSFWAKSDTARNVDIAYIQYFGVGGSSTLQPTIGTVAVTTSWSRVSVTYTIPSIAGKTIGPNNCGVFRVYHPQNINFTFDMWGVQMESGSIATPFTTNTGNQQAELAACQRYYHRFNADTVYQRFGTPGVIGNNTTTIYFSIIHPTTMRANPSFNYSSPSHFQVYDGSANIGVGSLNLDQASTKQSHLWVAGSGYTAYRNYQVLATNTTSAWMEFSAEL